MVKIPHMDFFKLLGESKTSVQHVRVQQLSMLGNAAIQDVPGSTQTRPHFALSSLAKDTVIFQVNMSCKY